MPSLYILFRNVLIKEVPPMSDRWSRPGDLDSDAERVAQNQPGATFLPRRWDELKTQPDTSAQRQREGMRLIGLRATAPMTDLPTGDYGESESAPAPMADHQPQH